VFALDIGIAGNFGMFTRKEHYAMSDLLDIMDKLRQPDGCPWDREQIHESIRQNLIEEAYEAAEAIDTRDTQLLCEELGDMLLQVVFHAQIEKEQNSFDFDDVCDGICKKLVSRHPHVFSDVVVQDAGQALQSWDAVKRSEKGGKSESDMLGSVSKALPALMRSEKVQSRAAKAGFDYDRADEAFLDLKSELAELEQAIGSGDACAVHEELGDLLFAAVNVSRFASVNAEKSLADSCEKFISRFVRVEALARERNIDMKTAGMDSLNNLWAEAKR